LFVTANDIDQSASGGDEQHKETEPEHNP